MRIYLDFDGVLHGVPYAKGPFEHLPAFEEVLRQFPRVEVVITSSWREQFSLEEMRSWFSEDVQRQVVGVTPVLPEEKRVAEIRAHLKETGHRRRFVVIDDAASQFPRNYPPLLLCDTRWGLRDVELEALVLRLGRRY